MILKYNIKADYIEFWCTSVVDENNAVATLFNDFLFDISKERRVYFYAYRLPCEDEHKMIDATVILAKTGILLDPFKTFFHLSDAKVNIERFDCACEAMMYYFKNEVKWSDFLASSVISRPEELIKKGILSACFSTTDQGADFWFECNKTYEKKVLQLFECLSNRGCEIEPSSRLSFPDSI